ncbi:hypothetical protein K1W54_05545 [Micromonospora sp. CPCC 205371]|nr:hypothetical protein [Micromonospora sp. CPCC 205371]
MRRSNAVPLGRGYLTLAALVTTAGFTAACQTEPEQRVYCADADGVIVDDDRCDDDRDGRYFLWAGAYGRGLKPGQRLPGGTKIAYGDTAARQRYGLPATGKVSNGEVVSGGFGSDSGRGSGGG